MAPYYLIRAKRTLGDNQSNFHVLGSFVKKLHRLSAHYRLAASSGQKEGVKHYWKLLVPYIGNC